MQSNYPIGGPGELGKIGNNNEIIQKTTQNAAPVQTISDYSIFRNEISCGSGYIKHGFTCCADSNSNTICDVDEGLIAEEDIFQAIAKLNCGKNMVNNIISCCPDTNKNAQCDLTEQGGVSAQEALLQHIASMEALFECSAPYLKAGRQVCCLDQDNDKVCDLPFVLNIKSVAVKHIDNEWDYKLDKLIVDYNTKKSYYGSITFEAYDNANNLVSSASQDTAFNGAETNRNIISTVKAKFPKPGVYTLKLHFFDGRTEIGVKSTKALVGVKNENFAGSKLDVNIENFNAEQPSCVWIKPKYAIKVQNSGDADLVYTMKKTYMMDGNEVRLYSLKEPLPILSAASSTNAVEISDMSENTKSCYDGKTLSVTLEFFNQEGQLIISKEAQTVIVKK